MTPRGVDARLRGAQRRLEVNPDDTDAYRDLLIAHARNGDAVASVQLAMMAWLAKEAPQAVDPEVVRWCSDPARGLAYDDERFGRMCYVPSHVAILGSREDDHAAHRDETPQMAVAVPAFYVAQEPMTLARWRALGRTGGSTSPHGYVIRVSWHEVIAALGQAPDTSGAAYRVNRGGGWNSVASNCRSAVRYRGVPGGRYDSLGFRVARTVEGGSEALRVFRGGSWYDTARGCRVAYRYRVSPGNRRGLLGFRVARPTDGGACRLPTEDEWEAAARGPLGSTYPWGNEWRPRVEGQLGPASASWCGVQGLSGTVWQWSADAWSTRRHPAQEDGSA